MPRLASGCRPVTHLLTRSRRRNPEPDREGCPARPRLVTAWLPLADIRPVLTCPREMNPALGMPPISVLLYLRQALVASSRSWLLPCSTVSLGTEAASTPKGDLVSQPAARRHHAIVAHAT